MIKVSNEKLRLNTEGFHFTKSKIFNPLQFCLRILFYSTVGYICPVFLLYTPSVIFFLPVLTI